MGEMRGESQNSPRSAAENKRLADKYSDRTETAASSEKTKWTRRHKVPTTRRKRRREANCNCPRTPPCSARGFAPGSISALAATA